MVLALSMGLIVGLASPLARVAPLVPRALVSVEDHELGVLPIAFSDNVAEHVRASLDDAVGRGVERSGVSGRAVSSLRADDPSMTEFLRIEVTKVERDFTLDMTLVGSDGTTIATRTAKCELCGVAEVSESMDNLAAALATTFAELPRGPGILELNSDPSGADVFVDGEAVGTTPLRLELSPGRHQIATRTEGHGEARQTVNATSGVEATLLLRMQPIAPKTAAGPRKGIVAAGWSLFAVGLAGVGSGTALLVLDERPYKPSCPSEGPDLNGRCPERYNTFAPGVGLVAAGGVALGTGLGLIIWQARKGKAKPRMRQGQRARVELRPTLGGLSMSF